MTTEGEEKKRKAATPVVVDGPQTKKTKKSKAASTKPNVDELAAAPIPVAQPTAPKPIDIAEPKTNPKLKPRKRAVDFLSDEEEKDGGVSVDKKDDIETSKPEESKKKKANKDKAAVNGEVTAMGNESAAKTTASATKPSSDVPAATEPKEAMSKSKSKPKPKPKPKENSTASGGLASSSTPKKGPSTINVHAEKIKKLLGQKDNLPKQSNKAQTAANLPAMDFTSDGVNGISTNAIDETLETVAKDTASTSLQAEAQRTTEKELEDEYESDEDVDQAGALLKGFDSDNEDLAQDEGFDKDKPTAAIPNYKKTQKKLRQAVQQGNKDGPGVVYVGRIPHGFYENEMRQYFSQFGTISKLRLSRNRKTGHSKHFAFLEFESNEVAKIVAETMDNYLMFGHILKCKYVQPESLHPDTFKGANKRFRVAPHNKMEKRALEAPKSESQWTKKNSKEQSRREKKAEKLKAMGYEIDLPNLKSPSEVLQQKEPQNAGKKEGLDPSGEDNKEVSAPNSVPKDEVALSKKKSKKERKMLDPSKLEGGGVSLDVEAPQDEIAAIKAMSKKEKDVPDSSKADSENSLAPNAGAKVASRRKRAKKGKMDNAATAETMGVIIPTTNPIASTPNLVQPQNSAKENSGKSDKRKEKREKAKDNSKQLLQQSAAGENPSKANDQPAKPESDATAPPPAPAAKDQSSKEKGKRNDNDKADVAQATTDETPTVATLGPKTVSAEKETSSSMVPTESAEGTKSKKRSRKRKSSTAGHAVAESESEPKATEPAVTVPSETKTNGEPEAERVGKKTKKAKRV